MKFFIVLLAVVAAASAGYVGHGHGETYHVSFVPGHTVGPVVPGPHPKPISYHGNEHVNKIHWNGNTAGHPHLVGVEHYVAHEEPAIAVVKTHGHGHGW